MAYYNIDTGDGNELCAGISEHEIERVAKRCANELGETVYYYQGDTDGEEEVPSVAVEPDEPEEEEEGAPQRSGESP